MTRAFLLITFLIYWFLVSGCKEKPQVFSCADKNGATCKDYYGLNKETAERYCRSSSTLSFGTCRTRNLIGSCLTESYSDEDQYYFVKSYYLPMPEGWDMARFQDGCSGLGRQWLYPGDEPPIPSKLLP